MKHQLELFEHVLTSYADNSDGVLDNRSLYQEVAERAGLSAEIVEHRVPIGKAMAKRSTVKRAIRWQQQTLKALGLLEPVPGSRATWRITAKGRNKLTAAPPGRVVVAFSTGLGLALWADHHSVFSRLNEPIALCFTSPPYPLRQPRAYGNPSESEYVDYMSAALEPVVRNLVPGGSVCLSLSNDVFQRGLPARSLYLERLVLALVERLGLHLMDRVVWHNPSKPPGPVQWASVMRSQLNVAYEPILWFTNDPQRVRADNRRVLEPHTERHRRLMEGGGERRTATFGDGAYRIRPGDFGGSTPGRIPRNVIVRGHHCADLAEYRRLARAEGLPVHAAAQPTSLAEFFIRFLTAVEELVVDLWAGTLTTAVGAERNGRRWLVTERMREYVYGGKLRFAAEFGDRLIG